MRIAWLIYGRLDQLTGGYLYDARVIEGLRAAGDTVDVLEAPDLGLTGPEEGGAGPILEQLAGRVRGCDLLVEDGLCYPLLPALRRRVGGPPPRVVLLVHHLSSWEPEAALDTTRLQEIRRLEQQALAGAGRVICTSHHSARRLATEPCLGGRSAAVVEPGADLHAGAGPVSAAGLAQAGPATLLFVGHLTPRKGLLDLLLALEQLPPRLPWTLDVVGETDRDPAYADRVRGRLASGGLAGRVRLLGTVSSAELGARLAACRALVLPSRYEGYGMAVAEALHAGRPVVACRAGALGDLVQPEVDGLLVPPEDAGGLAAALARLLSDDSLHGRLVAGARARAATLPRWADTARRFRELLQQELSAGEPAAPGPRAAGP